MKVSVLLVLVCAQRYPETSITGVRNCTDLEEAITRVAPES